MSATDELRGGLKELGVQYQACGDRFTMWKHDGKTATYAEYPEGGKLKAFVTPAQAIAATVGRGTCKAAYSPNGVYCSVCHGGGLTIPRHGVNALRNFCPNCGRKIEGRKVVDE